MRIPWLHADGALDPSVVCRDDQTGCLLWQRYLNPNELGPMAMVPRSYPVEEYGRSPYVKHSVREILWEREHGPVKEEDVVAAGCGNRVCVNPGHGVLRQRYKGLTAVERASVLERKEVEGVMEAVARLGVHHRTIRSVRGPGGKRTVRATPLRTWLNQHLPEHKPTSVADLDWALAQAFAAGETQSALANRHELPRPTVTRRIKNLATALGYVRMAPKVLSAHSDD